jgi:hypothetical protein
LALMASVATYASTQSGLLPESYWQFPLSPQGAARATWPSVERSLRPADCGSCHFEQYNDWRSSLHAHAFSPGLVGQLLTFDDGGQIEACMNCHAPLAEQKQQFLAQLKGDKRDDPSFVPASAGNSCATCHVREHRRYGPLDSSAQAGILPTAHGGAVRSAAFGRSEFCAVCHQFPAEAAINGKPLENTLAEWQASRFAVEGRTCQGCHMPGKRHLFRGIHDPEMVASGLSSKVSTSSDGARFSLTSDQIGHAFPTYTTPRVIMRAVAIDQSGQELPGTAAEHVIERAVRLGENGWIELSDTRLLPGETASLDFPWGDHSRVRFWLDIYPDDYYRREVYPDLERELDPNSPAAALVKAALAKTETSQFRLFETVAMRPQ